MSDRRIHLFDRGSHITKCCHLYALDSRIQKDVGTYDPEAVTCSGSPDPIPDALSRYGDGEEETK